LSSESFAQSALLTADGLATEARVVKRTRTGGEAPRPLGRAGLGYSQACFQDERNNSGWVAAGRMGKFPVRLKEVVYTVSPFEVSVLSGLWKDLPEKISRKFREVRARRWRQRRSVGGALCRVLHRGVGGAC
jgi:hypothetical protein